MSGKILIFQQIVPSYRVPVFKAMHYKFGSILCHSLNNKSSRIQSAGESIDYPHEIIKNYDVFGTWQIVIPTLFKYKPDIVIIGIAATNFTFFKLFLLKYLFRYKLIAWGHGVNNKEISKPLSGLRGRIIKFYFKNTDAIVFYSEERMELVKKLFPILKNKMFIAPNTLDLSEVRFLFEHLKKQGKNVVKKDLGKNFNARYNLIFIGRLLKDKRVDLLLQVFNILHSELDIALHIVGSGEDEIAIRNHKLLSHNIFYYGAVYDDEITGKYLFASDLFVMPGYVGLSIIHAFAYGLPVVTCKPDSDGPFHSPEIEYLKDQKNGFLCPKSPEEIALEIKKYLVDPVKQQNMKICAEKTAYDRCTIENMINGFEQAIKFVSR